LDKSITWFLSFLGDYEVKKASQKDKWESKPNDNPFIIHSEVKKRAEIYRKMFKKMFRSRKKEFTERYKRSQSPFVFPFSLLFKRELSLDEWYALIEWIVDEDEMKDTMIAAFVNGELPTSFIDVLDNTVAELELDVTTAWRTIRPSVIAEYQKFNESLSVKISWSQVQQLKDIITFGLEDGKSVSNIASDITERFEFFSTYEAERIARTETIRATSRWAMEAYSSLGIEYYEVLPALTACPICVDLASQNPYRVDDASWRPPFHPNCRCSIIPFFK
jgi:SPP1 gp7 family putative phage head morphogenesis protein